MGNKEALMYKFLLAGKADFADGRTQVSVSQVVFLPYSDDDVIKANGGDIGMQAVARYNIGNPREPEMLSFEMTNFYPQGCVELSLYQERYVI